MKVRLSEYNEQWSVLYEDEASFLQTIQKLIDCLHQLVEAGHSVVVIEHHLDLIKVADYVIDMGPEGGNKGGTIIAAGMPEEIASAPGSLTGHYLREVLPGVPTGADS